MRRRKGAESYVSVVDLISLVLQEIIEDGSLSSSGIEQRSGVSWLIRSTILRLLPSCIFACPMRRRLPLKGLERCRTAASMLSES